MGLLTTVRERGLYWATAHALLYAFDKFVEFVVSPAAIIDFGLVMGTAFLMAFSFVVCIVLITIYDWVGNQGVRDLLGYETIRNIGGRFGRRLGHQANSLWDKTFKLGVFLYLSIMNDPMTCTLVLRESGVYRMSRKDWRNFIWSVIVSNVAWGLMIWGGFGLLETWFPEVSDSLRSLASGFWAVINDLVESLKQGLLSWTTN